MKAITKNSVKEWFSHFGKTLKYSLHCIVSPFDGFWDLTHEKRGSVSASVFLVILTVLTSIWKTRYTSFVFIRVQWEYFNIILNVCTFLLPFFIWILSNWCLTTLFDGKGTMKDIFMGSSYALTPYVLIQLPMIVFSNFVTYEEGAFYAYFLSFSMIWCGFLYPSFYSIRKDALDSTSLALLHSKRHCIFCSDVMELVHDGARVVKY